MLEQYGDFLEVKQTATELHISEWSVRDMCRKGTLPSVKVGRRILIPKKQLIANLESHMTGAIV